MNRALVAFLVVFNLAVLFYVFYFYHIVDEVQQEIKKEKDDSHNSQRAEKLQSLPEYEVQKADSARSEKHKFRPLGKDEPIPRGMHVRINMQTGEREGRWLSEDDNLSDDDEETSIVLSSVNETDTEPDLDKYNYESIGNDTQKVKQKFRSYEQIKKEMADLNLLVKTDAEILNQHMRRFLELRDQQLTRENVDEIIVILKDFENLLHQVDNGEEFAKQKGMSTIVAPLLKANVTTFRSLGANILGAAVQNNAKAQISALKAGVIPLLLHNIASNGDLESRSSSMFALSCLVRSFPLAEMKLIEEGGLPVLMDLFDDDSADGVKLQLKVVTFLSDLIIEKEDAKLSMKEKEQLIANVTDELPREEFAQIMEKFRQYSMIELNSKLFELGWCEKLGVLLTRRSFKTNANDPNDVGLNLTETDVDHDIVDKVVSATLPVAKQCREKLVKDKTVVKVLPRLLEYYKNLSGDETDVDDTFYHDIHNKINQLSVELVLK
ncbi:nucleotide exchange factor SIL1 [Planococcus citri]|uniref:nucleotide exchange factor SIL1 n=1 Tax=Planococcus citri TaxID=170843 RepID=UPI0031F94D55